MAAWVAVRAAVTAAAGLAVTAAVAAAPAVAAQPAGGSPASHLRPAAAGQHTTTTGMNPRALWAHVAVDGDYTCGVRADGTLWCWGNDAYGQLGIGHRRAQDRPKQVTTPVPGGWANVTAGGGSTCATRADGTLWCWGNNAYGQLGIGNETSQYRPRQVTTSAPGGWASVAVGGDSTCAIRADATLWCWGDNALGELGIGNHTNQDLPQQVTTPAPGGWASVTAGSGAHACAARADGTLWCWGWNNSGQLGIGNDTDQDLPQQVTTPAPGGWASVTAGYTHTCAIRADSTLWCWGYNEQGELGIGNDTDQDLPQQVTTPAPAGWASTTGGSYHTCATRADSTLWCWGWNYYGQLGIGNHASHDLPQQVASPAPGAWASVTAGYGHTCATRADGTLWCWGWNHFGQLGTGNRCNQDRPRQVTGSPGQGPQSSPARATATRRPARLHLAKPAPAPRAGTTGKATADPATIMR